MLSEGQVYVLNAGDSASLDCVFHADAYNLFDYPVLWRKTQRDEETQVCLRVFHDLLFTVLSLPLCLEYNNGSYCTADNGDRRLSQTRLRAVLLTPNYGRPM